MTRRKRKPYVEHFTLRLDEDLLGEIETEALLREEADGMRISRGEIVRCLIREGLASVRRDRLRTEEPLSPGEPR